uniref:Uncharacterized protein n=1 Tax=Oryza punctata TaxID=4537 RepID=A0A0E0KYG8_ORYPU
MERDLLCKLQTCNPLPLVYAMSTDQPPVAVSTVQNGAESDFACVLSFPAAAVARNGSAAAVFDGGRCVDARWKIELR